MLLAAAAAAAPFILQGCSDKAATSNCEDGGMEIKCKGVSYLYKTDGTCTPPSGQDNCDKLQSECKYEVTKTTQGHWLVKPVAGQDGDVQDIDMLFVKKQSLAFVVGSKKDAVISSSLSVTEGDTLIAYKGDSPKKLTVKDGSAVDGKFSAVGKTNQDGNSVLAGDDGNIKEDNWTVSGNFQPKAPTVVIWKPQDGKWQVSGKNISPTLQQLLTLAGVEDPNGGGGGSRGSRGSQGSRGSLEPSR